MPPWSTWCRRGTETSTRTGPGFPDKPPSTDDAHAGWFDGQSAATIALWDTPAGQTADAYTDTLADLVTRRAPQLFAATGYPPSSTPTPTP